MESTLKNMILTLFAITLISAGALSVVYSMTKDAIELSKSAKTIEALSQVLPEFDNDPSVDTITVVANNLPALVYTAKKGGVPVGYAVATSTKIGYSGDIRFMVGFLPNGEIENIKVLEHAETPGLGSKIADDGNPVLLSFKGKSPGDLVMKVTKDGGDIDVITASTISSRAYTDAVERAYTAFKEVALGQEQESFDAAEFMASALPGSVTVNMKSIGSNSDSYVAYFTKDEDGNHTGIAVESIVEGYGGDITMFIAFLPDGTIADIAVVHHMETPGFGAEIEEEGNPLAQSFIGRNPSQMKISFKSEGGDVDAISGSSITSQAYVDAVENAYKAVSQYLETK